MTGAVDPTGRSGLRWLNEIVPPLEQPTIIMMLTGWIDAGRAAALAAEAVIDEIGGRTVAVFDDDMFIDFRARRPIMQVRDGVNTVLDWQRLTLTAGTDLAGHDVLVLSGPEPDMAWNAFADLMTSVATTLAARMAIGLGAYPFATPHTRPSRLSMTTASPDLAASINLLRSSVDVPAGVVSLLEHRLHDVGIKTLSLWSQVPHYVSTGAYPAAAVALLDALRRIADVVIDGADLRNEALEQHRRIDSLIANNPEHQQLVRQLETVYDQLDGSEPADGGGGPALEIATGDEIADELERFLRDQGSP